jgi:hypothetical protein
VNRVRLSLIVVAVALLAMPAGAARAQYPGLPWTELLPAFPSALEPQPGPVPNCRKPSMRCIDVEVRRLRALRDRLGCDHRGVFATTYLTLTKELRDMLRENPGLVERPRYLFFEDALFANVYFDTVRAWNRGETVPAAWRVAFEAAENGNVTGAQDMLLGINAHVQNDMPFVLAALGLRTKDGGSRKLDHDRINAVLTRAYEPVVRAVSRYDPTVSLTNASWHPIDDVAGLEVVRAWREIVWRNAERLVNARDDAHRARIAAQIEAYAGLTARLIAAVRLPGHAASRDAYCRSRIDQG